MKQYAPEGNKTQKADFKCKGQIQGHMVIDPGVICNDIFRD